MIAVLNVIAGAFLLLGALGMLLIALGLETVEDIDELWTNVFLVAGAFMALIGIGFIIMAVGLLKLKPWARTITIALAVISIILEILDFLGGNQISLINLVIDIIIIWYLMRPHVKAAFEPVPY